MTKMQKTHPRNLSSAEVSGQVAFLHYALGIPPPLHRALWLTYTRPLQRWEILKHMHTAPCNHNDYPKNVFRHCGIHIIRAAPYDIFLSESPKRILSHSKPFADSP